MWVKLSLKISFTIKSKNSWEYSLRANISWCWERKMLKGLSFCHHATDDGRKVVFDERLIVDFAFGCHLNHEWDLKEHTDTNFECGGKVLLNVANKHIQFRNPQFHQVRMVEDVGYVLLISPRGDIKETYPTQTTNWDQLLLVEVLETTHILRQKLAVFSFFLQFPPFEEQ